MPDDHHRGRAGTIGTVLAQPAPGDPGAEHVSAKTDGEQPGGQRDEPERPAAGRPGRSRAKEASRQVAGKCGGPHCDLHGCLLARMWSMLRTSQAQRNARPGWMTELS
jgi:hypothetical protein